MFCKNIDNVIFYDLVNILFDNSTVFLFGNSWVKQVVGRYATTEYKIFYIISNN